VSGLILASTSSARRALMDGLGLPYRAVPPEVDEQVPEGTPGLRAVELLAERKARAVLARHPEALVIGSDQLVLIDGEALGKPADRAAAREQLLRLSGRRHQIATGLCLVGRMGRGELFERCVEVAELELYPLESAELERYLDLEEWRGCAGGYRVEGAGQALFARIEGDRTGVQGLPMVRLVSLLRKAGLAFFVGAGGEVVGKPG
jgi:septum formation protein